MLLAIFLHNIMFILTILTDEWRDVISERKKRIFGKGNVDQIIQGKSNNSDKTFPNLFSISRFGV